jgi:hypothetical protein
MKRSSSNSCSQGDSCPCSWSKLEFRKVDDEVDKIVSLLDEVARLFALSDLRKGLGGGKGVGEVDELDNGVDELDNLDSERFLLKLEGRQTVFLPAAKSIRSYDSCAHEISGPARYSSARSVGCEMHLSCMVGRTFRAVVAAGFYRSTSVV